MNLRISRRKLAALAATVTATGGLLSAAPAAHAAQAPLDVRSCPSQDMEVDFTHGGYFCDLSHSNHRDTLDNCDVTEVYSGSNWVAVWAGPDLGHLTYYSMPPNNGLGGNGWFCVGDIAVNP